MSNIYRIRVENHLDESWGRWFGSMQVVHLENGESELVGPVADEDRLQRILEKIRDLNLVLLSIARGENEPDQPQVV